MTIIKEIIKIQGGYSAQVKLKEEFENRIQNIERMSHYKPIQAHRKAFEIIAEGIYKKDSKRCFVLSGSYGTGKSHLSLMAANYLESPSDMPEMDQFFQNYAEAEAEEKNEQVKHADQLRIARKAGRYLVCICDFGIESSFETVILRAIKDALVRENINIEELDSYYLQAVKKLDLWQEKHPSFHKEFEQRLETNYPSWTMAKFKKGLKDYSKDTIEIFKEMHKEITTTDFDYERDNLVEIIKQMANSKLLTDQFKGITILFDEFDNQIKNKKFDVTTFQKFGEMCENSFASGFITLFVATIHRSFLSYKNVYNDADFQVASDRVKEIALETQGIEDIISAIVIPDKNSGGWKNEVDANHNVFNQLASKCATQGIFSWLSIPKLRDKIIKNIYPMHPMATYSLLKLAADVGSNNRSVFTFFADEKQDIGSYDWFVRNHSIIGSNAQLQLYTVDLLFDYFCSKITTDNTELRSNVKEMVKDYETSVRELNKHRHSKQELDVVDIIYDKILHTMIIYNIIGVAVNFENLKFGLYINSQHEEKQLEAYLTNGNKLKIIYLNDTNNCYEFRKNDAEDISGLIREYKQNPENIPTDIIKELKEKILKNPEAKLLQKFFKSEEYLVPKDYNATYNEDKRLKRVFCTVKELESEKYLVALDQSISQARSDLKNGYEATVVYVLCESADEVRRGVVAAGKNQYSNVLIGVPSEEITLLDLIFSAKACININTENFSAQDLGVLKDYIKQYDKQLAEGFDKYISSSNLVYYGVKGAVLSRNIKDNNKAPGKLLEDLYDVKRSKVKHEDLNFTHEFKEKKNTALKEAVESLLDFTGIFAYRSTSAADRGDKRYIEKVLLNYGVIVKMGMQGDKTLCQLEEKSEKYKSTLPALVAIIDEIQGGSGELSIIPLLERLVTQYGLGYNAVILFFAVMLRYFKESVHIKPDVNEIGSLRASSYDELLDIIYHKKYKNAVLIYKKISERDQTFVKMIKPIFINDEVGLQDTEVSISNLYDAMKNWYYALPAIAQSKDIYKEGNIQLFLDVFKQIDSYNPVNFVLEEIKTIYGYDRDDLLLEEQATDIAQRLKQDKEMIENGYEIVRDDIIEQVKTLFFIADTTYDLILQKINIWYENLSDVQKSIYEDKHNENSKPIVQIFGKGDTLEELLMVKLPGDKGYKLNAIKEWTTDKRSTYIEKIRLGKKHIEENVFVVEPPEYTVKGDAVRTDEIDLITKKIWYRKKANITINPLPQHEKIYITSNQTNPTSQDAQREVSQEPYIFEATKNHTIKFAAIDKEGRYSTVITLILENEDEKYVVNYREHEPKKQSLWGANYTPSREYDKPKVEPKVEVTLPKDKASMKCCLLSLFKESMEKYKMSKDDLRQCLDEIKKEL